MVGFSKFKILGVLHDVAHQRAYILQGALSPPSGQNLWDKVGGSQIWMLRMTRLTEVYWHPHQDGRQLKVGNPKPQNSD